MGSSHKSSRVFFQSSSTARVKSLASVESSPVEAIQVESSHNTGYRQLVMKLNGLQRR